MDEAKPKQSSLNYRPDIDGLRAVAVLSVMACHLRILRLAGGFVGVDVFFVISGYLISSIIFAEIAASRFSIVGFYQRRIRRIFPALFAMLFVFTVFALFYFFPINLVDFSSSLLSATVSVSNFWFWLHSGYFDNPTSNPLLHTWSLAVEEQFYILFPLFLVIVRRFFPKRLKSAVVVLFFASLLASEIVVHHDANTAFYMPYTRAWELLLGTIMSLRMFPPMRAAWLRNAATILGAALILCPVIVYTQFTVFPGLSALPPCLGSALIIAAGESGTSAVASVLSWRPVVFVGLISYSLYLWHWPVIVLMDRGLLLSKESTLPHQISHLFTVYKYNVIVETTLSFAFAVLSWRFVERPFRIGSLRLSGKPLFALATGVVAVFIAFSLSAIYAGGFKSRFSPESVRLESYVDNTENDKTMREGTCFVDSRNRFQDFPQDICLHRKNDGRTYLLLGDSHAAMLWSALDASLPGTNVLQATVAGCSPFVSPTGDSACTQMMSFIYRDYLPSHPVQELLLASQWQSKHLGALTETVEWAKQHNLPIVVFGPVPEYDSALPQLEAYALAFNDPALVSRHRLKELARLDAQMQDMATKVWHVPYISLYQTICPNEQCAEFADPAHKIPLMFDGSHLSFEGSTMVIHRLIDNGELR